MNTFTDSCEPVSAPTEAWTYDDSSPVQSLDRTLTEIRSGRRLQKIVTSIESFLHHQVSRLDTALEDCRLAEANDRILQEILKNFEQEKRQWEETRDSESRRLTEASEKLIQGWTQLEDERRNWLDERDGHINSTSR